MNPENSRIGEKIRSIRQSRGHTQKELARLARIGESALRSYELGDRLPKQGQIEKIAMALRVRPEALNPTNAITDMDVIYSLFEFEDMGAIVPVGDGMLKVNNCKLSAGIFFKAFNDWAEKKAALDAGEITADEYAEWKRTYNPNITVGAGSKVKPDRYTGIIGS